MKKLIVVFALSFTLIAYANNPSSVSERDPFFHEITSDAKIDTPGNIVSYEINQLQVLGEIQVNHDFFAVITDPSGRVYKLAQGDKVAPLKMQITAINKDVIKIKTLANTQNPPLWTLAMPAVDYQ